jgi:hypothetical protein
MPGIDHSSPTTGSNTSSKKGMTRGCLRVVVLFLGLVGTLIFALIWSTNNTGSPGSHDYSSLVIFVLPIVYVGISTLYLIISLLLGWFIENVFIETVVSIMAATVIFFGTLRLLGFLGIH